jgi:hypothetical protein
VLVYGYYAFPKPSVHGLPTSADPADRNCRYLVQSSIVPSMARLRGYQRPLRPSRTQRVKYLAFKLPLWPRDAANVRGFVYTDTFSTVIRMASLRLFLAIVAAMDLDICQLDIDTAFPYAPIREDVYIRHPLGFSDGTRKVCHLKRCMYGLQQSPPRIRHLTPGLGRKH